MDTGLAIIIAAIIPTLPAILSYIQSRQNARKLDGVHQLVNSDLTRLVEATASKFHAEGKAEGILEGVAAEKAHQAQLDRERS